VSRRAHAYWNAAPRHGPADRADTPQRRHSPARPFSSRASRPTRRATCSWSTFRTGAYSSTI
jgi:hypothetical protein